MDNHYHLVLQTMEANLMQGMQWLNSGYSGWFNRRHRRCGHLLQGRYKAIVVEPEQWGLELSRYVHLNPIRVKRFQLDKTMQRRNRMGAGRELGKEMWEVRIQYLRNYRWSSYRAYVGLETPPEWLTCSEVLRWLGAPSKARPEVYQAFVESAVREGLKQIPWDQLQAQLVLGGEGFLREVQVRLNGQERVQPTLRGLRKPPPFEQVVAVVEKMKQQDWKQFSNRHGDWGRDMVFCLARQCSGLTLNQLGQLAGQVDSRAVSKAIQRFQSRLQKDHLLARLFTEAANELSIVAA